VVATSLLKEIFFLTLHTKCKQNKENDDKKDFIRPVDIGLRIRVCAAKKTVR
jgi:hypothetical protein